MKQVKIAAAFLLALCMTGCSTETTSETNDSDAAKDQKQAVQETEEEDLIRETVKVEMEIEDYGTIVLELDGETAPVTVTNFVNLVQSHFYDGLTFHRIMDGFMIQGGDPLGTGYGGSGKTIVGEFKDNGYDNPISHQPGTISMARSTDYDSASSQFFICVADDSFLDGSYAAFGHVTEGYEICEKIAADAEPIDNNGTIEAEDQPKIISARVIEE